MRASLTPMGAYFKISTSMEMPVVETYKTLVKALHHEGSEAGVAHSNILYVKFPMGEF